MADVPAAMQSALDAANTGEVEAFGDRVALMTISG